MLGRSQDLGGNPIVLQQPHQTRKLTAWALPTHLAEETHCLGSREVNPEKGFPISPSRHKPQDKQ